MAAIEFGTGTALAFAVLGTATGEVPVATLQAYGHEQWAQAFTNATGNGDTDGLTFTPTRQLLANGKGRVYVTAKGKAQAVAPATTARTIAVDNAAQAAAKAQAAEQAQAQADEQARKQARDAKVGFLLAFGRDDTGAEFLTAADAEAFLDLQLEALHEAIARKQDAIAEQADKVRLAQDALDSATRVYEHMLETLAQMAQAAR